MVMPLWDHSPLEFPKRPVVTWGLIAANFMVFFAQSLMSEPQELSLLMSYALIPGNLTGATILPTSIPPLTLITYQFLHADILHIGGNMLFLFIFGDDVEEAMGSVRFLLFYLACGIVAGLAFTAASPHSQAPLIGASGAIAGVLAAYLMFRPCEKVAVFVPWILLWFIVRPVVRLDAFWVLGAWALTQLWALTVQTQDGVAYMAHIGGFAAGAVLFPLLRYRTIRLFECMRPEDTAPSQVG